MNVARGSHLRAASVDGGSHMRRDGRVDGAAHLRAMRIALSIAALLLTSLSIAACAETRTPAPCRFADEYVLATTAPRIESLDLALEAPRSGLPQRGYVVWSAREGTYARAIAASGAPRGQALRLGPSCAGGVAATQTSDANTWIACLRRGNVSKDDTGGVIVWRLANGAAQLHAQFGAAGREALGIALVAEERELVVLWQDATPGQVHIMRAEIPRAVAGNDARNAVPYTAAIEPRAVSVDALVGSGPALVLHDGHAIASWAEIGFDETGGTVGRLLVDGDRGAAAEATELGFDLPMPHLIGNGVGGLALAYRDTTRNRDKSGLYVVALGDRLRPMGAPRRIARANGPGGATLTACAGSVFAVAPRTYQRDILVGITRLSADLATRGREQQVYEDGIAIAHAAMRCSAAGPLLVVGERGSAARPVARVRATTLVCDDE